MLTSHTGPGTVLGVGILETKLLSYHDNPA